TDTTGAAGNQHSAILIVVVDVVPAGIVRHILPPAAARRPILVLRFVRRSAPRAHPSNDGATTARAIIMVPTTAPTPRAAPATSSAPCTPSQLIRGAYASGLSKLPRKVNT